jgi:hypothetical protein
MADGKSDTVAPSVAKVVVRRNRILAPRMVKASTAPIEPMVPKPMVSGTVKGRVEVGWLMI